MKRLLLVVFLAAMVNDMHSGQRFVSVLGSDTASGSFFAPWRTIQRAANHAAEDDTVFIRGGLFNEKVILNVSGSPAGFITFMPFAAESVVISGAGMPGRDVFLVENKNYVRILGLTIEENTIPDTGDIFLGGAGIRVQGECQSITIANNIIRRIRGVMPQGIVLNGNDAPSSIQFVRITGNTIHSLLTDTANGSYGGSGIRLTGSCDSVTIAANTIHDIRAVYDSLGGAMAITIYGTSAGSPITRTQIDGNMLHDCQPARSEAIAVSGNVEYFRITYNTVYNMNNVGVGLSGGYGVCADSSVDFPRHGDVRWNTVYSCNTRFEEGYCPGIYVDSSRDIVVEGNRSFLNDIGIGVNAEQVGRLCDSVLVRSNLMWGNGRSGLSFGGDGIGYWHSGQLDTSGIVQHCRFTNNTLFDNNRRFLGQGEIAIEDSAFHCAVLNNVFFSTNDTLILSTSDVVAQDIHLDYNIWFARAGADSAVFRMNGFAGPDYTSFDMYRDSTAMDGNSLFTNPRFVDDVNRPPNLHLVAFSPAVERGQPNFFIAGDELDIDEDLRLIASRVDIGADEYVSPTDVAASEGTREFRLYQNFPNPFNPATTIRFSLPERKRVELKVFDVLGREVATLVRDVRDAGSHAVIFDGSHLASGLYFCRLVADTHYQTSTLVLLK